MKKTWHPP